MDPTTFENIELKDCYCWLLNSSEVRINACTLNMSLSNLRLNAGNVIETNTPSIALRESFESVSTLNMCFALNHLSTATYNFSQSFWSNNGTANLSESFHALPSVAYFDFDNLSTAFSNASNRMSTFDTPALNINDKVVVDKYGNTSISGTLMLSNPITTNYAALPTTIGQMGCVFSVPLYTDATLTCYPSNSTFVSANTNTNLTGRPGATDAGFLVPPGTYMSLVNVTYFANYDGTVYGKSAISTSPTSTTGDSTYATTSFFGLHDQTVQDFRTLTVSAPTTYYLVGWCSQDYRINRQNTSWTLTRIY